jgi:cell division septum initiation protein DivIVA
MPTTSFADVVTDWEQLLVKIEANAADLAFLEGPSVQLTRVLQDAKEASARQATFKSEFHQATRDLEDQLRLGRDLATRLRNGIRMRYGLAGEKLGDFKLRPRRQKTRSKPTLPEPELSEPSLPAVP